ncbi:MAG: hypothetical protein IPJ61_16970 [Tessaracoccus sp.]|nr:hypothetical protein [Tessaracoccus sp.]
MAPEEKVAGIANGLSKINQGTDSHLAFTARLREFMTTNPSEIEPAMVVKDGLAGMREAVALRMREWNSTGKADLT